MVMPQKKKKPKPKPVINYPPLTLRKWVPPYLRPKKKRKPKWEKPPGMNHPIPISTLVRVWRNFLYIEDGDFYVLHGSHSERNARYGIRKGCQGMSVCMAAITYSKTVKMSKWSRHVIDDLMDVGNRVYHESVQKTTDRTKCQIEKSELQTTFYLGDAKITMTTKGGLFEGQLFGDYPESQMLGSVLSSFLGSGYESGIICAGSRFMAVWSSGTYYLLDPGDHGTKGEVWEGPPGSGFSVVIRSGDVGVLAKLATDYFGQKVSAFEIMPCAFFSTTKYDKRSPDTLQDYLASIKQIPQEPPERVPPAKPSLPAPPKPIIEEPPEAPDYNNLPEEEIMPEELGDVPEVPEWKKPTEKAALQPVSYFIDIKSANMGIMRATTHQCDPRFSRLNGVQVLGNAIAAITMLRMHKSRNWIPKFLDEILKLGDWIYNESKKELDKDETLTPQKICKRITLYNQDFTADIKDWFAIGQLQSKIDGVFNLTDCLKTFFADNDACIIWRPAPIALWYEDRRYFMFNPDSCDHLGQISPGGLACVTWYKNVEDLVETYTQNLLPALQRDQFFIDRVVINDYVDLPEDWFSFKVITSLKWILRSDFSIKDKRFEKELRNIQYTAVAIMALTYQQMHLMEEWDVDCVNDIIEQGHNLHKTTMEYLTEMNRFNSNVLTIPEIKRKFLFESNQIVLETEEMYSGLLDAKDENDVLNLQKAMHEFYRKNYTIGLVTARSSVVAFWQHLDSYFYFDPYSRDEKGLPTSYGKACCLRVLSLDDLVGVIESNFAPSTDNTFTLTRVSLAVWIVSEDGIARPPANNYVEIDPDTSILQSTYSVDSDYFKLNAGKQLIPMTYLALAMPKVYPPATFDVQIVNQIMHMGDKLYTDTLIERSKLDLPDEEDNDIVTLDNCIRQFDIGFNNFNIERQEPIEGNFEDNFIEAITGYINANMAEDFTDNQLLITCDYYTVAIWKENGLYYLFDAAPRDATGQYIGKDDWSIKRRKKKPPPPPEEDEDEEGEDENKEDDEDDDEEKITNVTDLGHGENEDEEDEEVEEEEEEEEEDEDYEPKEKHSESYWAEFLKDGRACVMRFILVDKLINFLLENTPPNAREDLLFKIYPVRAQNLPKIKQTFAQLNTKQDQYSGNWYNWHELDHGLWIVRGTIDQSSELFPLPNRGNQQVGNAFAALAYATLYALKEFKSSTVDSILRYGDRVCSVTLRAFGKTPYDYSVADTMKMFCIGIYQIEITVEEKNVEGHLRADETSELLDVNRALEQFFGAQQMGVFECKGLAMAIWRGPNTFFMFDPYIRGPNGKQNPNGVACITRYLQIKDMADVIRANLPEEGSNSFYIHLCTVEQRICPRPPKPDEFVQQDLKPSGFELAVPGKFILRGTLNQNDKKFGRYENALSAPIAIVALTMTLIHKTETWTQLLVDEILMIGNELYQQTVDAMGLQFNPWDQAMNVHLVSRMYNIGTLMANCEFRNNDQTGIIDTKEPKVLNLRRAVELFFAENTHGVIETETLTVAVWEELDHPGYIFMFDPNPRGPAGLAAINGRACVLKLETITLAVEHFIANVDKDRRQGAFVITPVEIVVGKGKKKKLAHNIDCKKKQMDPGKKRARERAEAELKAKLAMRLTKLGRMTFYDMGNGVAILRGSKSQTSREYSMNSRGNQDIPNCFIAYIVNKLVPISEWQFRHIDTILDAGDQLYKDSYITYLPRNQKLGLQNVLREIVIKDVYVSLVVYKPVIREELNAYNLEVALINVFQQEKFCMITNSHEWVAVFFCAGYYYMFDAHDNDVGGERCKYNGTACVLRYDSMRSMIMRYLNNVSIAEDTNMFTLILIGINSIKKMQRSVST